jgi:hypothetical protein
VYVCIHACVCECICVCVCVCVGNGRGKWWRGGRKKRAPLCLRVPPLRPAHVAPPPSHHAPLPSAHAAHPAHAHAQQAQPLAHAAHPPSGPAGCPGRPNPGCEWQRLKSNTARKGKLMRTDNIWNIHLSMHTSVCISIGTNNCVYMCINTSLLMCISMPQISAAPAAAPVRN